MAHIRKTEGAIHESAVIVTLIAIILQEPLMAAASRRTHTHRRARNQRRRAIKRFSGEPLNRQKPNDQDEE